MLTVVVTSPEILTVSISRAASMEKDELLNKDFAVFGRAQIHDCMPFDEYGVGDYDVGVIFLLDGEDNL